LRVTNAAAACRALTSASDVFLQNTKTRRDEVQEAEEKNNNKKIANLFVGSLKICNFAAD